MSRSSLACLAAKILSAAPAFGQNCEPQWSHEHPDSGFHTLIDLRALAVFDDGSGPHMYAGGDINYYPETDDGGLYLGRWDDPLWGKVGGVDPSGPVSSLLTWDDGSGPALYVGGQFHDIGAEPVRYIAKWDGKAWSYMDTGLNAYPALADIRTLAVFDDGSGPALYAGGVFTKSGDLSTDLLGIARWDGQHWQAVGGGMMLMEKQTTGTVNTLTVHDDGSGPALYAGGQFDLAGDVPCLGLAKWNGKAWSAAGDLLEHHYPQDCPNCAIDVRATASFDDGTGPALYIAGRLQAPGVPVPWIARLREGQWEQAGEVFGHRRYGGQDGITELDTLAVRDVGAGPALYLAGMFQTHETLPGEKNGGCLARWDGGTQSWIDLDANPTVKALMVHDEGTGPRLWVGGPFGLPGGQPGGVVSTLGPDGWKRVGLSGHGGNIAVFDDGSGPAVYMGGSFVSIGDLGLTYDIARWTAEGWAAVGTWADLGGDRADVQELEVLDLGDGPGLYANLNRLWKDGSPVGEIIARWNGQHWSAASPNYVGDMYTMFAYDDGAGSSLYSSMDVGNSRGELQRLENGKWATWATCGGGEDRALFVPAVTFDDGSGPALWVGGDFTDVDGVAANYIARYRPGSGWEHVGAGMNRPVLGFAIWDDPGDPDGPALIAGGVFSKAGGVVVNGIARWDGKTWHPFGVGFDGGNPGSVYPYVWDDGSGPALYAYGWFKASGNTPLNNVAKWDGAAWTPLGIGTGNATTQLAGTDVGAGPELFVAGGFVYAGGYPSPGFAVWIPCHCPADLDADGTLTLFDFLTFVNAFNTSDPAADCDASGALDLFDFLCFTNAFNAGC